MKIGLFGLMFIIMFTLKLAGPMAGVSWAIVTAPLWVPVVIALGIMGLVLCGVAIKSA